MQETSSIPELGRSPGEGKGYSLQYSCLENSMDRGAWQAAVHGVTKSQTQLNNLRKRKVGICSRRAGAKFYFIDHLMKKKVKVKVSHSVVSNSLPLCGLQPPGSSVCRILQARILEWVAISFSRGSF